MILVDTGPIVAAASPSDDFHVASLNALGNLRKSGLLITPFCAMEVCYMLATRAGAASEASFIRSLADGTFSLVEITIDDLERIAELIETYADLSLGAADASVVATAERLKITQVLTLDRRHFTVVRPSHVSAFDLLP